MDITRQPDVILDPWLPGKPPRATPDTGADRRSARAAGALKGSFSCNVAGRARRFTGVALNPLVGGFDSL